MNPLFVAIFEDGTKFEGGDYINTKWMEIPNKKIRTMGYRLPNGDWLMLHKYEEYFHMVEVTTDIIGDERKSKIEYIYIMGKRKGIVKAYKIDIRNRRI